MVVAQGLLKIAHKEMKTAQSEIEDWQRRTASLKSKHLKMIDNANLILDCYNLAVRM